MTENKVEETEEDRLERELYEAGMPVPGPCGACGRNPALGYASVWNEGVETWFCHPDEGFSCYSGDVA